MCKQCKEIFGGQIYVDGMMAADSAKYFVFTGTFLYVSSLVLYIFDLPFCPITDCLVFNFMSLDLCIDGSGICGRDLLRVCQRSKCGTWTIHNIPRLCGKQFSSIPEIGYHEIVGLKVVEGTFNHKIFKWLLKNLVLHCSSHRCLSFFAPRLKVHLICDLLHL